MCSVMETWTQHGNVPEQQYIKANLDTAWIQNIHSKQRKQKRWKNCSNIFTQNRGNRKDGELQQYTSHIYMLRSYPSQNIHLLKQ